MTRLLLVVTLMISASIIGSTGEESASQEEFVVTVDSTNLRFSPSSITISEGDTVRFFWSGELLGHNAVANDGLFDSGDVSRNVDYSFTFEVGTNGSYGYICEPHEEFGMIGTIVVEPIPPSEPEEDAESEEKADSMPGFGSLVACASMCMAAAITSRNRT